MKYRNAGFWVWPFSLLLLFSCKEKRVGRDKLIGLINKSKTLHQTIEVNSIKVEFSYFPHELFVLQELGRSSRQDTAKISVFEKKYGSQYYFKVFFSKNNQEAIRTLGNFQKYSEMVQTMSFDMEKYVRVINDKSDTVYLKDFMFEQDYGLSNSNALLLVFDKDKFLRGKVHDIAIHEFGLGIGTINFRLEQNALNQIPKLEYNY